VKDSRSLKKFGGKFCESFTQPQKVWREVWVKVSRSLKKFGGKFCESFTQPQKVWREVWVKVSRSLKKTYPNIFYVIPSDYVANLSTCARFKIVDSG
jgi:hypothetical protein